MGFEDDTDTRGDSARQAALRLSATTITDRYPVAGCRAAAVRGVAA